MTRYSTSLDVGKELPAQTEETKDTNEHEATSRSEVTPRSIEENDDTNQEKPSPELEELEAFDTPASKAEPEESDFLNETLDDAAPDELPATETDEDKPFTIKPVTEDIEPAHEAPESPAEPHAPPQKAEQKPLFKPASHTDHNISRKLPKSRPQFVRQSIKKHSRPTETERDKTEMVTPRRENVTGASPTSTLRKTLLTVIVLAVLALLIWQYGIDRQPIETPSSISIASPLIESQNQSATPAPAQPVDPQASQNTTPNADEALSALVQQLQP